MMRTLLLPSKHRDGLLRGIVGQAEDGDIGAVQQVFAHGGVAALGFRNGQELDIRAAGHAAADLQARGAVFAIDEDFRFHDFILSFQ